VERESTALCGFHPPLEGMVLKELSVSGPSNNRVNLMFFGDGCEY
jgi:hypothetical protein